VANGVQHVDNHTTIDHAKPHCNSRQFYNGILDGHATGVFNGRVIVRPNAQKTDAVQKNRNLLLSTDATVDTKPQLEISANDVRCTHGATVGQMDAEALFFLRSRGLERAEAVAMLVQAFASEILDKVRPAEFKDWLTARLSEQLLGAASGI
jgi:Fe-S cluster assembly protein SufD